MTTHRSIPEPVPSPALVVEGLQASYGQRAVLAGLDLTVASGITAVLGPSGCGKTTLLRSVAGFVTPDAGDVRVNGRPVLGSPPRRRGVGYVPQEGALFPHLDVAGNITFGLRRGEHGNRAERAARVAELLDLLELPRDLAGRYPHQLSGGQQQRVAVARALAPRPALVLLDEPFSSLDAGLREETGRAVVRALAASSAAALLVTHDQGEALSLADQVAVMAEGRFLQVAPPAAVYLTPGRPEVASFLGGATLLSGERLPDGAVRSPLGDVALQDPPAAGPLTLVVRAEQVQVVPPDEAVTTSGVVAEVSYFGHDATLRVRLPGGELVTARVAGTAIPAVGSPVGLLVEGPLVAFASDRSAGSHGSDGSSAPSHPERVRGQEPR